MAIQLEANYSKKLGLPGYSSHQYSVTIRTELTDPRQVESESSRLYSLLQGCVDRDIQETGYLPDSSPNGHQGPHGPNGNGRSHGLIETWSCTDKQKGLILKIVDDHALDRHAVDALAQERFSKGVRQLNRMEASGLIEELLETHGKNGSRTNGHRFQKVRAA